MRKAFLSVLGLAIFAGALMAPLASAANEQIKIREFFAGGAADDSYVVLQAYAPNQNHLAGHTLKWTTNPITGGVTEHNYTLPSDVGDTASQSTVLLAEPGYSGPVTPDFVVPELTLWPNSGLFCLDYRELPEPPYLTATDCVWWGGDGGAQPPQNDESTGFGYPAFELGGINPGRAAIRLIGLGCPTLLEGRDDTNMGNSDWYETTPNPRDNASQIVEKPCNPPHTGINSATVNEGETTASTSVRIAFAASPFPETTYECKLDAAAFAPCVSPVEYTGLDGSGANGAPHKFEVRATSSSGVEQTPASRSWIVNTSLSPGSVTGGDQAGSSPSAAAVAARSSASVAVAASPAGAAAQGGDANSKPKAHRRPKHRHARHTRH